MMQVTSPNSSVDVTAGIFQESFTKFRYRDSLLPGLLIGKQIRPTASSCVTFSINTVSYTRGPASSSSLHSTSLSPWELIALPNTNHLLTSVTGNIQGLNGHVSSPLGSSLYLPDSLFPFLHYVSASMLISSHCRLHLLSVLFPFSNILRIVHQQ
jgi:hypothetical protein